MKEDVNGTFSEEINRVTDACEPHCLNCGRPVEAGQMKCECGYELADFKCPHCGEMNEYTNRFCTDCGKKLWQSHVEFPKSAPRGCRLGDGMILDVDFIQKELVRTPHQSDGEVNAGVLRSQYVIHDRLIEEICSRWWIVSPANCISCKSKIDPLENICPQCNILHHDSNDKVVMELKTIRDDYVKIKRNIDGLSRLKWTYKLSDKDLEDYFLSLAPAIGESQFEYRQRLFKEYGENCAISYLINCEWNIYFEGACIHCGGEFEKYRLDCPSCGRNRNVPALSVLFNDDYVERESFSGQFAEFSRDVRDICMDNGGDASYIGDGIAGCPGCFNYFHYLTPEFMNARKCPHCGAHFRIDARIFQDEWDQAGLPYDEYMATYYGLKR